MILFNNTAVSKRCKYMNDIYQLMGVHVTMIKLRLRLAKKVCRNSLLISPIFLKLLDALFSSALSLSSFSR